MGTVSFCFHTLAGVAVVSHRHDSTHLGHRHTHTLLVGAVCVDGQVGQVFSAESLSIESADPYSGMAPWQFGQVDTGNLLGTIRSLDELGVVSLNCTENANITVHDEQLHCEWGVISRNGWAVVDDTQNQALSAGAPSAVQSRQLRPPSLLRWCLCQTSVFVSL